MTPTRPAHLADALRRPGYLISAWPWRALAYLITTVPLAGVLATGPLVVAAPLLAAVNGVRQRTNPVSPALVAFLLAGALLVLALAPLVGAPVAALERWRLGLVDDRPLPGQPWRGLAARYTTAAAWWEAGYAFLLGAVVPVAYWTAALLVALDLMLVASPWLADDTDPIVLVWTTVDRPDQAIPYAVLGVLLLPVLWYGLGALAAAQGAAARWLLGRPGDLALREVNRSRTRLVTAYEAERRRIERDVHDGVQPRLTSLTLQLGLARLDVAEDSPAARPLAVAHGQATELMAVLRQVVHGIRPQSLTDLGLAGAVRELAGEAAVPVTVHVDLDPPPPDLVETTAYYVVSECLGNVARHAGATRAEVRLARSGDRLVVEVSDDGRGGADPARGTGLTGLADRVAAADGRLLLASPPGGPTLVRVELPCRR
ncbi:sensor histidine kinase [Micromonospora sp. R77]|uniref:sensor histidine kinase n=1 Tax=Micromonospora sp. R77 TaxID=2925836 RepID=UPI001F60EEA8|nr:sensor histidine kinase [Micromonospora sp. R77]MCI4062671.1 sensor histidine kinase [Micromonospora sp. R77]